MSEAFLCLNVVRNHDHICLYPIAGTDHFIVVLYLHASDVIKCCPTFVIMFNMSLLHPQYKVGYEGMPHVVLCWILFLAVVHQPAVAF